MLCVVQRRALKPACKERCHPEMTAELEGTRREALHQQRLGGKEPGGAGISDMRGVGNRQPGLRGSAFGAKGQRHAAEKPMLPLPVMPCREQVLPRIVLFKKRRLFYLLSGRFLQPLFSRLRGSVSLSLVPPSSIWVPLPLVAPGAFNMHGKI